MISKPELTNVEKICVHNKDNVLIIKFVHVILELAVRYVNILHQILFYFNTISIITL